MDPFPPHLNLSGNYSFQRVTEIIGKVISIIVGNNYDIIFTQFGHIYITDKDYYIRLLQFYIEMTNDKSLSIKSPDIWRLKLYESY
jgi:hypothetical protein